MAKVAGSIWVEGNDLHYIDQFNREWYMPGQILHSGAVGVAPGSLWIDPTNHYVYYISEDGHSVCFPFPYGDRVAPLNAKVGSLWVDNSDNQLHWITELDPSWHHNVRAHNDVAPASSHVDTHVDGGHVDVAHADSPHSDVPSFSDHGDGHQDIPHGDVPAGTFTDSAHGDYLFTDHFDAYAAMHYDVPNGNTSTAHMDANWSPSGIHEDQYSQISYFGHADFGGVPSHGDQTNNTNIPHEDYHTDSHADYPHSDIEMKNQHSDHGDGSAHSDVIHTDSHTDVAHGDTHGDSHGDTPHHDEPIYIGP